MKILEGLDMFDFPLPEGSAYGVALVLVESYREMYNAANHNRQDYDTIGDLRQISMNLINELMKFNLPEEIRAKFLIAEASIVKEGKCMSVDYYSEMTRMLSIYQNYRMTSIQRYDAITTIDEDTFEEYNRGILEIMYSNQLTN